MKIIERLSKHFSKRPEGTDIDCIVIHYTAGPTANSAVSWFLDPTSQVSAHYVVDYDGTVYRCVPEIYKAWHAGESELDGEDNVNRFSIGIELQNTGSEPYPQRQITALIELTADIMSRYKHITVARIVGHDNIATNPRGRKKDPGPLFPWDTYRAGVRAKLGEMGL